MDGRGPVERLACPASKALHCGPATLQTAQPGLTDQDCVRVQALVQAPSVFVAYMDVLTALATGEKGARSMYQQVS